MKGPEGRVCVIGATGTLGSRVVERLVGFRIPTRGVARDPAKFRRDLPVEYLSLDVARPEDAERAVEGCKVVFVTPPIEGHDPITSERRILVNVLNASQQHGVRHFLVHTILDAGRGGTGVRMIDAKKELERLVEASGIPFTILRPGWFLENLRVAKPGFALGEFTFPLPEHQRFGAVSADDVAKIAVKFILKGAQNRAFDLHLMGGVDAGTLTEVAGRVLGHNVSFTEAKVEEFLQKFELDHHQRELHKELFHYMRDVPLMGKPEDVTRVLPEFQYTSAENFLREFLGEEEKETETTATP